MNDQATPEHIENIPILAQILELEAKSARSVREWILGDASATTRIKDIDTQIAALRSQLVKE